MRYQKFMPIKVREQSDCTTAVKILDAAYELFLSKGLHCVTLRDIAALADVNVSLIPYHFISKENLAKRVNMKLIDTIYRQIDYSGMDDFTNAEKLYISNLLHWDTLHSNKFFSRFYMELIESTGTTDVPTAAFVEMSEEVIHDYGLSITKLENETYLTVLKGSEQLLIYRYLKKELNITYTEIIDILISNYFYNIGLPDKEIARIISKGHTYYEKHQTNVPSYAEGKQA